MAIVYDHLMNYPVPVTEQSYTERDTMLYALGLGFGHDPVDEAQLPFVYEKGLKAVPTMGVVLAWPGLWLASPDTGIDYGKVVHGEQSLRLHRPIPPSGTVIGRSRVAAIIDKGEGRGALVRVEREVSDKATGDLLATVAQVNFCRADGGFGGPGGPQPAPHALPERAPDIVCDLPSVPQAALIYRLSGDRNPLHADPASAVRSGFPRPILHGLATYGIAGHAVLKHVCGYDPARLRSFDCRFTAPVFPGETFRTEIWVDGDVASFRTRSLERDVVAISNGRAEIA